MSRNRKIINYNESDSSEDTQIETNELYERINTLSDIDYENYSIDAMKKRVYKYNKEITILNNDIYANYLKLWRENNSLKKENESLKEEKKKFYLDSNSLYGTFKGVDFDFSYYADSGSIESISFKFNNK